jgi:hypothetical protein
VKLRDVSGRVRQLELVQLILKRWRLSSSLVDERQLPQSLVIVQDKNERHQRLKGVKHRELTSLFRFLSFLLRLFLFSISLFLSFLQPFSLGSNSLRMLFRRFLLVRVLLLVLVRRMRTVTSSENFFEEPEEVILVCRESIGSQVSCECSVMT